ncbi:MAG: type VII secretion protein EssC [Eubacterium sp.]|nr:type VII secretion protein EssC [Eubacterium sp.]
MLAISLKYKDNIYYNTFGDGETISFGSGSKDTIQIGDMTEKQLSVTSTNEVLSLKSRSPFSFFGNAELGTVCNIDKATGTSMYVSRYTGKSAITYTLQRNSMIRLGRAGANDIAIGLPFVSGKHLLFSIEGGRVRVEDQQSSNGTYLNGKRITSAEMHSGDVINILTVRIILNDNVLSFENVGNSLNISAPKNNPDQVSSDPNKGSASFRLSPRIQDCLPSDPIILDRPPKKGHEYHPRGSRIGSIVSMGAMAGTTLITGAISPALAFARAASLAMSVFNMASSNKIDKKRQAELEEYNKRRDEEYRTYIEAQRVKIIETANEQRTIITNENPGPAKCIDMLANKDRRIWERRNCDRDFLDVRIGMSYEELCVPIKNYAENRGLMMEDDELEELCNSIAEENRLVDYIPKRLSLRTTPTIGVFGNRDKVIHQIRNMIVSFTTHHTPFDIQLVGIFDNSERNRWGSLRWLPHIWDSNRQFRYLAFDKERAHQLCDMLYDELKKRKNSHNTDYTQKDTVPLPHYVVILGNMDLVKNEPVMELLGADDKSLGVSTFFLFDDIYNMPRDCGCFIDMTQEFPFIYDRFSANKRVAFSRDPAVSAPELSAFVRKMAALELEGGSSANSLPSSITFLEGFGVKTIEELRIKERWENNHVSDTLSAQIGVLPTGKTYSLDIHYKAHGAHGLIAGTTGSGKSELLRTWILSMAVNYHPHEVNFVIIDYKGGGMANKLETLPHLVGKITNIDTNISRSLVSLKREAKRRMIMLEKLPGIDDVDQYMQLYYSGKVSVPMPHLIIVSDEFAELKKEEPEFLKELSSLARVGRSVGIHLVLATQRPSGVVDDQIDSNSRFRICMKVNSVQDSKEMIKRPDAAGITQRGRAYIRIGEDEEFSLIQTYWSGAAYSEGKTDPYPDLVRIVDVTGERIQRSGNAGGNKSETGTDQLTAIVDSIADMAERNGIERLTGPWMPPLPEMLSIQSLGIQPRFNGKEWLGEAERFTVPVGLFDRPALQEQDVQYLDFTQTPHYAVYGAPLSGKTTLLKTIVLGLGLLYSPDEVNIDILDFGGGSLSVFEDMPHVTNVIREGEDDRIKKLMEWMDKEIQTRKNCFRKEKVSNFSQYFSKKKNMPALFLVIDNQLRLSSLVDNADRFLADLSMTGPDCGIHIIFTSNNANKTSMNIQANIGGNIALHMADKNDYRSVVSEFPEGCGLPKNPGRGIIRDSSVAEFQTAVYADEESSASVDLTEALVKQMSKCACVNRTDQSSEADVNISYEEMAEYYGSASMVPVGMDTDTHQPVYADLSRKHSLLISSADQKTGTAFITALSHLLLTKRENRLYILDGRGELEQLKSKATAYASDEQQYERVVNAVAKELERREDILFTQPESANATIDATALFRSQICIVIDNMSAVMSRLSEDSKDILAEICRSNEELGYIAVAHGTTSEIASDMDTCMLTAAFVDNPDISDYALENHQKGVCLGGILKDHKYFSMKQIPIEVQTASISESFAFVCDSGKVYRIKHI